MITNRQQKKLIRNMICIVYCCIELGIVLAGVKGLEFLVLKLQTIESTTEEVKPENKTTDDVAAEEKSDKLLVVCIDAGHGGKDGGSTLQTRYEKDDNLTLAKEVEKYLKEEGIEVIMTRSDDTYLNLKERSEKANTAKADYFISIHRNTGNGNGVETWISSNASAEEEALAENIMTEIISVGVERDRGIKKGTQKSDSSDYAVNLNTNMPSCLIELGFMNSTKDNELFDRHYQEYAKGIAKGIINTWKNKDDQNNIDEKKPDESDEVKDEPTPNKLIDNVESLDNTIQNWGQGLNVDDKNRPVDAVAIQEKYNDYNALFLIENSDAIYLTLDEGYEYGLTESILDTLKEKDVKAVFFVTQPYVNGNPELVKRMIDDGHVLGNHSVTHPADGIPSLSIEKQQREILDLHDYVKANFDYEMNLFRYPAGKFSDQSLAVINNCNYKSIFWSFAYMDYDVENQPDQAESLQKMIDRLHPGAIYLLHAESATNAAVLGAFIDAVRAAGYSFELL